MPGHKTSPHVFIVPGQPGRTAIDGQPPDGPIQRRPQDKQPVLSRSLGPGPHGPTYEQRWAEVLRQLKAPCLGSAAAMSRVARGIRGAQRDQSLEPLGCAWAERNAAFFPTCPRRQAPAAAPLL
ncbi:hypothetical protein SKAU_G00336210 [Synaphobranchus kaupii]|uniref:Uncharacterized protein n=1 Tax=Synaphobranchus kaupii TaxID=118154 RepID=A0A9Q1EM22_SYNKA|nr:hypothetical protein SKAU_G00336210 [Synaphobranchus kaupii]